MPSCTLGIICISHFFLVFLNLFHLALSDSISLGISPGIPLGITFYWCFSFSFGSVGWWLHSVLIAFGRLLMVGLESGVRHGEPAERH